MARPTLASLANELGVSRQTVANVINAPHLVKESTRERVRAAIEASGYRPNVAAQALRSQRSRTVAMRLHPVQDGINGTVMDRFVRSLLVEVRRLGHNLTLVAADDDVDEAAQLKELYERGAIDGCIVTGSHTGDLRPSLLGRVPFVCFGRPWGAESEAAHPWIDVDGAAGVRAAVEHLRDGGGRRIGLICGPADGGYGDDRRSGWEEAMDGCGVEDWQSLSVATHDDVESGVGAAQDLLERGVDAIVCTSDALALGALSVAVEKARQGAVLVPVIGFDDSAVAAAVGLSSVHQPVEECARELARVLVARLEDEQSTATITQPVLEPTLVLRNSVLR